MLNYFKRREEDSKISPKERKLNEIKTNYEMEELNPKEPEYCFGSPLTVPIRYVDTKESGYYYDKLYGNSNRSIYLAQYQRATFLIRTLLLPSELEFAKENISTFEETSFIEFKHEDNDTGCCSIIGSTKIRGEDSKIKTAFVIFDVIDYSYSE